MDYTYVQTDMYILLLEKHLSHAHLIFYLAITQIKSQVYILSEEEKSHQSKFEIKT